MREVVGLVDVVLGMEVVAVEDTGAGADGGELVDTHFFYFTSRGLFFGLLHSAGVSTFGLGMKPGQIGGHISHAPNIHLLTAYNFKL